MRTTCCFNDNWAFLKDVNEILTSISEDAEIVNLPHTWNGTDGQDGGNDYFRGSCCYVKNFTKSVLPTADEYYLEIHGANSSANVYLNDKFLAEILRFRKLGFEPILAHIERYKNAKGFRKLIKFIKANHILTQVNATAFYNKKYTRLIKKLSKEDLITFVASDTHSIDVRPIMVRNM